MVWKDAFMYSIGQGEFRVNTVPWLFMDINNGYYFSNPYWVFENLLGRAQFNEKFPTHLLFANFGCLRCGKCCFDEMDVCKEDIEKWYGNSRFDILNNVYCYHKNAFCSEIPELCDCCPPYRKVIVNRYGTEGCPFARKVKNKPYSECTINDLKPKICSNMLCEKSFPFAHINWESVDDLIQIIGIHAYRSLI